MVVRYIGFKENAEKVYRDSINKIISIPYFDLIIAEELIQRYGTYNNNLYHYQLLDYTGNKNIHQIGKYQLIEISPDKSLKRKTIKGNVYEKSREILFIDSTNNQRYQFESIEPLDDFIDKELWPLIKELAAIQDWDILMRYRKIPSLEDEIANLKKKINELENM